MGTAEMADAKTLMDGAVAQAAVLAVTVARAVTGRAPGHITDAVVVIVGITDIAPGVAVVVGLVVVGIVGAIVDVLTGGAAVISPQGIAVVAGLAFLKDAVAASSGDL
jgi:hypothetical protein